MKQQLTKILLIAVLVISSQVAMAAEKALYAVVDGTSMTVKYGDPGENPKFENNVWNFSSPTVRESITAVTIDKSCESYDGTDLNALFSNFTQLETITDIDNLCTDDVEHLNHMFFGCQKLTEVNISAWNTSKVTSMASMFSGCSSLKRVDISSFSTTALVNCSEMFFNCTSLGAIVVGEGWNLSSLSAGVGENMFYSCTELKTYDGTLYDASKLGEAYAKVGDGGYLTAPTLSLNTTEGSGKRWTTFYHGYLTYTIDDSEKACAYTGEIKSLGSVGKLTLHKLGKTIPAGQAVIIATETTNEAIAMTVDNTATATVTGTNNLHGLDIRTNVKEIEKKYTSTDGEYNWGNARLLVLGKVGDDVKMCRYKKVNSDAPDLYMPAHKAYIVVDFTNNHFDSLDMSLEEDDATGISEVKDDETQVAQGDDAWYTLGGMRLQGKPGAVGMYVSNGKKIIIK